MYSQQCARNIPKRNECTVSSVHKIYQNGTNVQSAVCTKYTKTERMCSQQCAQNIPKRNECTVSSVHEIYQNECSQRFLIKSSFSKKAKYCESFKKCNL